MLRASSTKAVDAVTRVAGVPHRGHRRSRAEPENCTPRRGEP